VREYSGNLVFFFFKNIKIAAESPTLWSRLKQQTPRISWGFGYCKLDFEFLTSILWDLTIVPKHLWLLVLLQYLVAWLRKRNEYNQDFQSVTCYCRYVSLAKGTLINPLHFDFGSFQCFSEERRNVWEYKSSFWTLILPWNFFNNPTTKSLRLWKRLP
jgi:hypothetical protein